MCMCIYLCMADFEDQTPSELGRSPIVATALCNKNKY